MKRDWAASWLRGMGQATPIVLGYVPIGFAYGVLAEKAGISLFNTVLMSLAVYAGASQFIAVSLLAGGVPSASIVITTLVVNLRHALMASAMSPRLKGWGRPELTLFGLELTDETFALHSAAPHLTDKAQVVATNVTSQGAWVLGSFLGVAAGWMIADTRGLALDFALPALFVALLVLQIKTLAQVVVAVVAGILAVALLVAGMEQWYVIVATLAAATVGVCIEQWIKASSL